jgi:hypothetical protein
MSKCLKSILQNADLKSFPYGRDYYKRFVNVEDYLNANVHPSVVIGASVNDGGLLNDHGSEHVQMVIDRASALLKPVVFEHQPELTPYEVFLLLCAIHVHDVGNIAGRTEHERNNVGISNELKPFLDSDVLEIEVFRLIAEAHGGKFNGSKDKLHKMPETHSVNSTDIRFRALAAILKFSDELADDKTRGNRRLLEDGTMPKGSEIYHKYSLSISSLIIRPDVKSIDLEFFLTLEDITRTWGKQDGATIIEAYIIDEIYARTKKMHLERVYCSRYMREFVEIDQISVKIEIWKSSDSARMEKVETIKYLLEETGYPDEERPIDVYMVEVPDSFVSGDILFRKYQNLGKD